VEGLSLISIFVGIPVCKIFLLFVSVFIIFHVVFIYLFFLTESQRYNCFIRNGGNAIPKHAVPEAEGSNPTTGLTLLWARNPFGGNFNHWQVSREEVDRFSLNDGTDVKKVLRFKYATWNIRGLGEKEEELDKILMKIILKYQ